jgi:hypothetical protein
MCGAIALTPPSITVKTADDSSECDPTFTLVDAADASSTDLYPTRCPTADGNCPAGATKASCTFVLFGVGNSVSSAGTSVNIAVSEPGYDTQVVEGVSAGISGCVSNPTPPTHSVVVLFQPLDAGTGTD